jgi:tRNA A-37 threonylcarbamoyl transferase component Bud32
MTSPRPDPRVGTELGPYHVERLIGRGGMGVVYLATHAGLQRRVALKLLAPDYADEDAFRARFLRESRMAAAIDHPNIIPIYEAGEVEGTYFLAMRYVEGTDLETRLRDGPLPARLAVHLLGQVASALDAAHAAGLVHRDVKPANVLVASGQGSDGADHAYLTDFGLTKQRDAASGLTRAGSFLGTVDYVAPEQIEGRAVDGRADQYALACLAFHALAGEVPFPRDSDLAVVNAHLRDDPPSLHERRPELPAAADAVIGRGMAKRPEDRYPSCRAFVDDLRAALGVSETDLHARPAATSRRRGVLAAGLGALLLAAVAVVALGSGALSGGPAATASPVPGSSGAALASPGASAASPIPSASAAAASPTLGPFPNEVEAAILAALPSTVAETCRRGGTSDDASLAGFVGKTPTVTINGTRWAGEEVNPAAHWNGGVTCRPTIGAARLHIMELTSGGDSLGGDTVLANPEAGWRLSLLESRYELPSGSCATADRASDQWTGPGGSGMAACMEYDGRPWIYFTFGDDRYLAFATRDDSDRAALYAWFDNLKTFLP